MKIDKEIYSKVNFNKSFHLDVSHFLKNKVSMELLEKICHDILTVNDCQGITKVMTVETSGIPLATLIASKLAVDLIVLKKEIEPRKDTFQAKVASYTKKNQYYLTLPEGLISKEDNILFIDDFLAKGSVVNGLLEIKKKAQLDIKLACFIIEKVFEKGHLFLENDNLKYYSVCTIESTPD